MHHRPDETEYAPFYAGYVSLVPESAILAVLAQQRDELLKVAATTPPDRESYRYAPGKWTIREVLGHVVDGERVFGHRAFCISRGEKAPLPSFDEKAYIGSAGYEQCPLADLGHEFALVRDANLAVLRRLDDEAWRRTGTASSAAVSVRALAFVMAGHVRHHLGVLRERYGLAE